jgi:UDP-galactopyranose mutase
MLDFLIVGAGCFGATFARVATDHGKSCMVIDKREHIAGNCFTTKRYGIDIHEYGAHIFHTLNEEVWNFVNRFSKFNNYRHTLKVSNFGKIYSFPINLMTLYQMWGVQTPESARQALQQRQIPSDKDDLESYILSQIGSELYETFVRDYTTKQWGTDPKNLPKSIIKRLPIRLTFDDRYFTSTYQGIPVDGYTALFTEMLSGIQVETGVDYFANKDRLDRLAKRVVYTGPIDQYFGYEFGRLGWRSLRFETELVRRSDYQGCSVMNYTDSTPFTRICEHKHFTGVPTDTTVITREFPSDFGDEFYPIRTKNDMIIYNRYKALASSGSTIFGGRLGHYKYIDMHQAIGAAMKEAHDIL